MRCATATVGAALCVTMLVTGPASAAGPLTAEEEKAIDWDVRRALEQTQTPGAAVVVVRGDAVVYLKGFGARELGGKDRVTPGTVFSVASCTKAFTATAIALLADEGKMGWDDPVRKHLPSFHLADPEADRDVTVRDLLCHRTGVGEHLPLLYRAPWGEEEIVRRVALTRPTGEFRCAPQYNNAMYLAAGRAAGAASRSTWQDVVRLRLFDKLGMTGASFDASGVEGVDDRAAPHVAGGDGRLSAFAWRVLGGGGKSGAAGAVNASASDLGKWLRFQLGDGTFGGKRLLSAKNLAETHARQAEVSYAAERKDRYPESEQTGYGLGWGTDRYRGHLRVFHAGVNEGFCAQITLVPGSDLGVAVLANRHHPWFAQAVADGVLDRLLGLSAKDWPAYHAGLDRTESAKRLAEDRDRAARRRRGTRPSREAAAYAGDYEEPAYGTARVAVDRGALVLEWSSFKVRLEHYQDDTFTARTEIPKAPDEVIFTLGADKAVATMQFLGQEFKKVKAGRR